MPKIKLTEAACQRLKAPPGERHDHFDALLPGLALRVSGPTSRSPECRKTWVVFYRYGGTLKRLTLEPAYPALGLADAREKARKVLQAVQHGHDPAAAKQAIPREERGPDTVEKVVDQFMRRHMVGKPHSQRYIDGVRQTFDNHILPSWRGRLIGSITRGDVNDLLDGIVDKGQATAGKRGPYVNGGKRGGPVAAQHALSAITGLFRFSIQRDIVDASPAMMIEKPGASRPRTRVLSDAELRLVWRATDSLAYPHRQHCRMLIACGQRLTETATMRWRDIDDAVWTIPADANKPHRTHVVPLSRLALAILDDCPRGPGFVFTTRQRRDGSGEAALRGYSRAKIVLDAAIARRAAETGEAVPEPFTFHDLRRTATTTMGRLGVARFVQARILNHADREVTGIYDRWEYLPEKRDALDRWARHIETLVNPPPPADVEQPSPPVRPVLRAVS